MIFYIKQLTGLKEFIYTCCIDMQQIAHISSTEFEGGCYQESLYKCTWKGVSHLRNWKLNREPDKQKVSEIVVICEQTSSKSECFLK